MEIRGKRFNWGDRTYIMGILNLTPDSFSDGGNYDSPTKAIERVEEMLPYIDILDIGGESTKPGAMPVQEAEELRRVIPTIGLIRRAYPNLPLSLDTMKAKVALEGIKAGVDIINDVSSGRYDPSLFAVVAEQNVPLILMHMAGMPQTMQNNPSYEDVILEITDFLLQRINLARSYHISQLIVDPGIGFGKTLEHNLTILRHLNLFRELGYPVLLGVSRKSFIGALNNQPLPQDRLVGTVAACTIGVMQGADIVRVHDPKEIKEATNIADAIFRATSAKRVKVKG